MYVLVSVKNRGHQVNSGEHRVPTGGPQVFTRWIHNDLGDTWWTPGVPWWAHGVHQSLPRELVK